MKKRTLLILILAALFPLQSMYADYCKPIGFGLISVLKYTNAFALADNASTPNTLSVTDLQTGAVVALIQSVYYEKMSSALSTSAGARISFTSSTMVMAGMHGALFIDYNRDMVFNNTANPNGTNDGEAVSFTYGLDGKTSAGAAGTDINSATDMPSFILKTNLTPGDYRARFIIDVQPLNNPCGNLTQLLTGGIVVDFTIRIPVGSRTVTVETSSSTAGTVSGGGTGAGAISCNASPKPGYLFLNWTHKQSGRIVSTSASYSDNIAGDHTLVAYFYQRPVATTSPVASLPADPVWYYIRTAKWNTGTIFADAREGRFLTNNGTTPFTIDSTFSAVRPDDANLWMFNGSAMDNVKVQSRSGSQLYLSNTTTANIAFSMVSASGNTGTSWVVSRHNTGNLTNTYVFGAPVPTPSTNGYMNAGDANGTWTPQSGAIGNGQAHWVLYPVYNQIISVPSGIAGGTYGIGSTNIYSYDLINGSTVNLVATPSSGYTFRGWSTDGGATIIANSNVASFPVSAVLTAKVKVTYTPVFGYTLTLLGTANTSVTVNVAMKIAGTVDANGTQKAVLANTVTPVTATVNSSGELVLNTITAPIYYVDCGTNTVPKAVPPTVENLTLRNLTAANTTIPSGNGLKTLTVAVSNNSSAAGVSAASALDAGVQLIVEADIDTSKPVTGSGTPTVFNFLSMPFAFATSTIEYLDPADNVTWRSAVAESQIRILTYNGQTRANTQYATTWEKVSAGGSINIAASTGFVIVGDNVTAGAAQNYKMKLRFKSAANGYTQTSNAEKIVTAKKWRVTTGVTPLMDRDWNLLGLPFLTAMSNNNMSKYTVYCYSRNRSGGSPDFSKQYIYYVPTDNFTLNPYEAFFIQSAPYTAGVSGDPVSVKFNPTQTPTAAVKATGIVSARISISIDGAGPARLVIYDDSSNDFIVNEDAWYMAPMNSTQSACYFIKGGSNAAVSVQPEIGSNTLAVYTGAGTQHTISMPYLMGELYVYLHDNVTGQDVLLNNGDYTFTAPEKTTVSNRFSVTASPVPTGVSTIEISGNTPSGIFAYATANGIMLYGLTAGEQIGVFSVDGTAVYSGKASGITENIALPGNGVFVVKAGDKSIKVIK